MSKSTELIQSLELRTVLAREIEASTSDAPLVPWATLPSKERAELVLRNSTLRERIELGLRIGLLPDGKKWSDLEQWDGLRERIEFKLALFPASFRDDPAPAFAGTSTHVDSKGGGSVLYPATDE